MINVSQHVDWYSITYPYDTRIKDILPEGFDWRLKRVKSPIPVYPLCYEASPLGIKILRGERRLGTHVIMSGKCLIHCRENGYTDTQIWTDIARMGGKISRIDLALDVLDSDEFTVNEIMTRYYDNECQTSLGGSKYIGSGETIETLYLGSMKSRSRRFRVYNKGIEQGVDYKWLRIEYEKRRGAMTTARNHFVHGSTIASIIKGVVNFPKWQLWQDVFNCEPAIIHREKPEQTDWVDKLAWLCQTSVPALANAVKAESDAKGGVAVEDSEVLNTFAACLSAELRRRFDNGHENG